MIYPELPEDEEELNRWKEKSSEKFQREGNTSKLDKKLYAIPLVPSKFHLDAPEVNYQIQCWMKGWLTNEPYCEPKIVWLITHEMGTEIIKS